jgi:hypothetical protein
MSCLLRREPYRFVPLWSADASTKGHRYCLAPMGSVLSPTSKLSQVGQSSQTRPGRILYFLCGWRCSLGIANVVRARAELGISGAEMRPDVIDVVYVDWICRTPIAQERLNTKAVHAMLPPPSLAIPTTTYDWICRTLFGPSIDDRVSPQKMTRILSALLPGMVE